MLLGVGKQLVSPFLVDFPVESVSSAGTDKRTQTLPCPKKSGSLHHMVGAELHPACAASSQSSREPFDC